MTITEVYDATIRDGGVTLDTHLEPVSHGVAVGLVKGTYATLPVGVHGRRGLPAAIVGARRAAQYASAWPDGHIGIGTWLDGDTIHVDPVYVFTDEVLAATFALSQDQIAYYVIHENVEVRL